MRVRARHTAEVGARSTTPGATSAQVQPQRLARHVQRKLARATLLLHTTMITTSEAAMPSPRKEEKTSAHSVRWEKVLHKKREESLQRQDHRNSCSRRLPPCSSSMRVEQTVEEYRPVLHHRGPSTHDTVPRIKTVPRSVLHHRRHTYTLSSTECVGPHVHEPVRNAGKQQLNDAATTETLHHLNAHEWRKLPRDCPQVVPSSATPTRTADACENILSLAKVPRQKTMPSIIWRRTSTTRGSSPTLVVPAPVCLRPDTRSELAMKWPSSEESTTAPVVVDPACNRHIKEVADNRVS